MGGWEPISRKGSFSDGWQVFCFTLTLHSYCPLWIVNVAQGSFWLFVAPILSRSLFVGSDRSSLVYYTRVWISEYSNICSIFIRIHSTRTFVQVKKLCKNKKCENYSNVFEYSYPWQIFVQTFVCVKFVSLGPELQIFLGFGHNCRFFIATTWLMQLKATHATIK